MNDVIDLAKQLMSCPSITPHDAGCQAIISKRLSQLGFHCETMRFGEVDNLWARYGQQAPLLVFAGHTDVVPPGPEADWQSPPFQPEIRNGYLYGRGAADMKGALAAMIVAAEAFVAKQPNFSGSIAFLITSDEEGPSVHGTKQVMDILHERGEKIDYCLIGEPSSDHQVGDQIRIGRRGSLHGNLKIHGKQGHVAHPHLAKNPIHMGLLALHELTQIEWDQGNALFPPTTFQITNLHSGTGATNVIPQDLEALFNFRYSTAITVTALEQRTEAIFHHHQLPYTLEWQIGALPFLSQKGKLRDATEVAIHDITGLTVKPSTGGGTSDGRFIAPTGAEVIELGTLNATAHHVNEGVRADDLKTLAALYLKIITTLFRYKK